MKHVSPYASKDLIYIYDNLDSPFLINPLNIRTQILKSPSASVESSKRARDVTRMSTLRFATKHTHIQTPLPLQSQIFALVPEPKTHSSAVDGCQTPTAAHSHTHTAHPKKIGLSPKQAIEVMTIMILSFTGEDREREPERQTQTESQISWSAENNCFLIPSEEFKGFLMCWELHCTHWGANEDFMGGEALKL